MKGQNSRYDCTSVGVKVNTAITRMVQTGAPQTEIMKVSGHTQMITFLRYVNPNEEAVRRAAELLDGFNAKAAIQAEGESVH